MSKLAIAWQAAAYGSDPAVFTPDLMASVTDTFLHQKVLTSVLCFVRVSVVLVFSFRVFLVHIVLFTYLVLS